MGKTKGLYFPEGFLWGTAASAHQVEGENTNSDWWAWEQVPGHIRDGSRSGRAADWWNRFEEDLDLARSMGQNAHRLSIEWSRIEPREGEWNGDAISHYRRVLSALRERDMKPMVTLHHFTNPSWLVPKGRWETERVIPLFSRYVAKVVEEMGDLARLWCTINEIMVYAYMSYLMGTWDPCRRNLPLALRVARNMILAHSEAYRAIHRLQPEAEVGVAHNMRVFDPARPRSRMDRWAAGIRDRLLNRLPLWALTEGVLRFPLGWGRRVPGLENTLDFVGLNYYFRDRVSFDLLHPTEPYGRGAPIERPEGAPDWYGEIYPEGLYRLLKELAFYGKPIYITENGLLDNTDERRPAYILTHLAAVHRAISEGVPVRGYFHWSLVDNFEWAEGLSARFGLVYVDFATQERRVKRSGELYKEICSAGGIKPEMVEKYAPEAMNDIFPSAP
ncbi:MAG: glycoside hydrolase family 1 protein [bacterium]